MNRANHALESEQAHQARLCALAATLYIAVAFTIDLITRERGLSPAALLLYILLSLGLALRFMRWTQYAPHQVSLSRELPWLLSTLPLLLAITLVLHDFNLPYVYLVGLEGYYTLAPRKQGWGIAWIVGVVGVVLVASGWLWGWSTVIPRLLRDVPAYLLLIAVLTLLLKQKKDREQMVSLATEVGKVPRQQQDHIRQAEALAVTQERTRIAREIHDTLGHTMTALDVQLELLARLPPDQVEEREQAVGQARHLVKEGLVDVRRAVKALRPAALDMLSPVEAIAHLVAQFERTYRIDTEWQVTGESDGLPIPLVVPLYRTVQEALTNVGRHAAASRVTVALEITGESIELKVEDNGENRPDQFQFGYGLQGLQERAVALGGDFHAGPRPHGGFQVLMRLPR